MKTRPVDRFRARDYLQRAEECKFAMEKSFEEGKWNACVINAVHCGIAAADAWCVHRKGLRSASENHRDAIALFYGIDPNDPDIKRGILHLAELISVKSRAEYGERLLNAQDATEAKKHAERLFDLIKTKIQ